MKKAFYICILIILNAAVALANFDCTQYELTKEQISEWTFKYDAEGVKVRIDSTNASIAEECKNLTLVQSNLSWMGFVYLSHGKPNDAIDVYKQSVNNFMISGDTLKYLDQLFKLGNAYLWIGDDKKSRSILSRGYNELLKYKEKDPRLEAIYFTYLSPIPTGENIAEIRDHLLMASDKLFAIGEYKYVTLARMNLVEEYVALGQFSDAIVNLDYVIKNVLPHTENNIARAGVYRMMAKTKVEVGEVESALSYLELAKAEYMKNSDNELLLSILSYEKVAMLRKTGSLEMGLVESKNGYDLLNLHKLEKKDLQLQPNLQYVLSTLKERALLYEELITAQKNAETLKNLDKTYTALAHTISLLLEGFEVKRGTNLLSENDWIYSQAITNLRRLIADSDQVSDLSKKGLWYSEQAKSQILKLKYKEALLDKNVPKEILDAEKDLIAKLSKSKTELFRISKESDSKRTTQVVSDITKSEAELERLRESKYFGQQNVSNLHCLEKPEEVGQIQASLGGDECILHILEGTNTWNIWYILSDSIFYREYSVRFPEIVESICVLDKDNIDLSQELCALVSSGVSSLIIVNDRLSARCSFESLNVCDDRDPVINNFNISYRYSICDNRTTQSQSHRSFWTGWAPSYNLLPESKSGDPLVEELVRSGMYHLPGAQKEVEQINEIINGQIFTDSMATKQSFVDHAANSKVIHLSMHTLVDHHDSDFSKFLFFSQDSTGDFGFLHSHELEEMRLHNTELAVLSACETGLGTVEAGEGVMSLARSFAFAGVPSTLTTLWKVPDNSTAEIITSFYRYLKEGNSKDQSLRLAKLDYLKKTVSDKQKDPFYWAGFVVMGNADSVDFTSDFGWYNFFLTLVILFFIGFIAYRLKA